METDSFFYQLLKQLPETLFAVLGQPLSQTSQYRFDAVEVKKSYRLDGLFIPTKNNLPLYFVEVQFRRSRRFYANLFAKVFSYLDANDSDQEWMAVALFASRAVEPKKLDNYKALLESSQVRRIYLNELSISGTATPGLTLLQLATIDEDEEDQAYELVEDLLHGAENEADCERAKRIVELTEEVLIRRYHDLDREEIRRMFKLQDIRKTRVWQEARQEGMQEGLEQGIEQGIEKGIEQGRLLEKQQLVQKLHAGGQTLKEIAQLLGITLAKVKRLAKRIEES